ncbi:MAG: transglycosylase domain-containing protein [Patescibacteria group bacterium]|nr:transglycosylase domain-containing protein [Patescibacteria group bacterium]
MHPTPHHSKKHTRHPRSLISKILWGVLLLTLIGGVIAIITGIILYNTLRSDLPSVEQITHRQVVQSTKIYDRTGEVVLYEISGGERRTIIPLADIPQYLRNATIAVEDDRFYTEPAFDWKAILRSFLANVRNGKIVQGGSTITQQLAKNAFLTPEQTITRKLKELILATDLNRHYSKDEILELYLNEIPYGPTAYGVEAASETFFNKRAQDLSIAEAAILASLPKAPTYYSPRGNHRAELLTRQQFVLKKMKEFNMLTEDEYEKALSQEIIFAPPGQTIKAPHFTMLVQDYLTQKYGEDMVQKGGLRVITSLDWDLQQLAEQTVKAGAERNENLYGGTNAALVAEDPKTGQVLALAGSRDYFDSSREGNFNVATQGLRQPGSSLKPFVYLTAFERGYTPETILFDVETEFTANNPECPAIPLPNNTETGISAPSLNCFHPHNFDGLFRGPITLRSALALSRNIPAVKVLYLAGMTNVIANAQRFGITTLTNPETYGLSLVLGGGAIYLADLVSAYATLANDGIRHTSSYILEIRDGSNTIIESFRDAGERIVDAQYVRMVNDILTDINARRALFGNSTSYTTLPDRTVALKTGTSNDYRDAWTLGYTPSLVVGVWAGNNDNSPLHKYGSSIFAAVPIWHAFFSEAHAIKTFPIELFSRPDPVVTTKPILAGDYLSNRQIHTILYSVDKGNPSGPTPQDPSFDPQFENWEVGVLHWASQNIPDFASYNAGTVPIFENTTSTLTASGAYIDFPKNGSVVQESTISIQGHLTGTRVANNIRINLNGYLVATEQKIFIPNMPFSHSISLNDAKQQNLLEINFYDGESLIAKTQLIFYR